MTSLQLAKTIAKALDNKLGVDIKILKVEDITLLTDYFVIASGSSGTQVRALADEAEYRLEQEGVRVHHIEGEPAGGWVLMDYGSVIAHIFHPDARTFYSLERLWADAEEIDAGG